MLAAICTRCTSCDDAVFLKQLIVCYPSFSCHIFSKCCKIYIAITIIKCLDDKLGQSCVCKVLSINYIAINLVIFQKKILAIFFPAWRVLGSMVFPRDCWKFIIRNCNSERSSYLSPWSLQKDLICDELAINIYGRCDHLHIWKVTIYVHYCGYTLWDLIEHGATSERIGFLRISQTITIRQKKYHFVNL